jgi:uncharacterized protein Usg
MTRFSDDDLKRLPGYGLTLACIIYRFPDYPHIISVRPIIRQFHDASPDFPRLNEFIGWWKKNIEGKIELVKVAHSLVLQQRELKLVDGMYVLKDTKH